MKRLLVIVFVLLFSMPAQAQEQPRAELLAGQCRQKPIGSGIWYVDGYPHELTMTSNCGLLSASTILLNGMKYDFGLRVALVQLGTIRVNSVFPMREDENAAHPSGTNCNPADNLSGCVGHGFGKQSAQGLSLGAIIERSVNSWTFGAEAGGFVYYGEFSTTIHASQAGTAFQTMHLNWGGWQITPYIGVNVRYGWAMLMLRDYGRIRAAEHGCGGCSGFAQNHAIQALAGFSVPF